MKGLVNFRDMGGVKTMDGRTVKHKRLLRSGEVVLIPQEDILELKNRYDLKVIVDFRSEAEVERVPDDNIEGVYYHNIFLHMRQPQRAVPPGEKEFRKLRKKAEVIAFMTNVYDRLIKAPFTLGAFARFIEVVKDNLNGAILFHCYAGKDRTGVAAAILYSILGVEEDEILREFLLTNKLRKAANEVILQKIREIDNDEEYLEALKVSYEVVPEYLEHVFSETTGCAGSMLNYIMQNMNVTEEDILNLRSNYLE